MINHVDCHTPDGCVAAFKALFDRSPFPVTVAEVSGEDEALVYINRAFTELTGYEPEDILGKSCRILQGNDTFQEGRGLIKFAVMQGIAGQSEFVNYRKDGTAFWNFVRVMPLKTRCTTERYMLGLQLDVTTFSQKLKNDYERHEERLTTIGRMSTAISHEINNPIAGVLMNLDYLNNLQLEGEVGEIVEESLQELVRVTRLIKSMLTFGRNLEKRDYQRICSVRCLVDEVLTTIEPVLQSAGVTFAHDTSQFASNQYHISANPDEVKQVLFSLMANAISSMAQSSCKRLTLDCFLLVENDQILFRVTDTGVVISDEVKASLFTPIFASQLPKPQGSGIDLVMSATIAQELGGILALDDDYTAGSRFLLYLPLHLGNKIMTATDVISHGKHSAILVGGGG